MMEAKYRENLTLLSGHLRNSVKSKNFNMRILRNYKGSLIVDTLGRLEKSMGDCDTVCCALGAGADVTELAVTKEDTSPGDGADLINWLDYGERLYGIRPSNLGWQFIFGTYWELTNFNSPTDAADRIDLFVKYEGSTTLIMRKETQNMQVRLFEKLLDGGEI